MIRWLKRVLWRSAEEQELDEEVRAFYAIHEERLAAQGMPAEEARRAVRLRFSGEEQVKESVREVRVGATMETFFRDMRYAARMLWNAPGFTFFAVLTIALALGANAAIFSLVDGVLLKSLGYPEPERMVQIWEKHPNGGPNPIAPANYMDWTRQSRSFEAMAAVSGTSMSYLPLEGRGEPVSLRVGAVSAPYFDVFGVKAAVGRTFARDEDQPGNEKVAVLTHRLWTTLFGGDTTVVGRQFLLNGERYTAIGILPGASGFDRNSTDLWIPLVFAPQPARNYHSYGAFARLKSGVSFEQAQAEMSSIAAGIAERYPDVKKGWGAVVFRYLDRVVGEDMKLSLTVLMWAVIAVLLIGCANLANLLMARATMRGREIAVRMAMGAERGRVVRMLLTESLLLSVGGAVAGVALGYGLLAWIRSLMPPFYLPPDASVALDGRVLLFLGAATLFTCLAVGLAPAWQASAKASANALKEGGRANSASRSKFVTRQVFVGLQVAVALILLVGGGLLVRSMQRLLNVDTGFSTEGLIAGYLPLPMERSAEDGTVTRYVERILSEVKALPGVEEAAVTTGLPLRGWGNNMPMRLPEKPTELANTGFKIISPRYLAALGLRLKAGRYLDERDTAGSPPVAVVNESFVKRFYPDGVALGKRILVEKILVTHRGLGPQTAWEIVGVVADEKGRGLESSNDVGTYVSFAQNPAVGLGLVVKGRGEGTALIRPVVQALARVEKTQVYDRPRTVEEWKQQSMMGRRLTTSLLAGLAALAVLLACAGVYGVLSFVTAQRGHELGIRAALGASRGRLIRLVLEGGAWPVVAGIAVGLAGALAMGRFIRAMLFATDPLDVPTLALVSALFVGVALVACLVPALRASHADPMTALRHD